MKGGQHHKVTYIVLFFTPPLLVCIICLIDLDKDEGVSCFRGVKVKLLKKGECANIFREESEVIFKREERGDDSEGPAHEELEGGDWLGGGGGGQSKGL